MRFKIILSLGVFSLLIACQETGQKVADNNLIVDGDDYVLLQAASTSELESEVTNYKGIEVLKICHVPPGNINKSKSMYIPLPAVEAHLNHGHNSHDYIGLCSDRPEDDDNSSSDDDSSSSDDDSSSDDNDSCENGHQAEDDDSSSNNGSEEEAPDGVEDGATPGNEDTIDITLCNGMTEEEIAACF